VRSTYEELCASGGLDLIILCTPPALHAGQTLQALDAGLHVFVEKPFATTLEDAERVVQRAASTNRMVAVDYPMIYSPLVEAITLFQRSRLAGPLLRLSVENVASCQGLADDHWFWSPRLSGGIFVEHGVHFFDWCGRLAGQAERVIALAPQNPLAARRPAREDRVFAAVQHEAGVLATYFHAFITTPERERTRSTISFDALDIVLDGWIPTAMHLRGQGAAVGTTTIRRMMSRTVASVPDARAGFIFETGEKQALYARCVRFAAEDLARSIREPGYIARCDVRNAIASMRVALAAREAAQTLTSVALSSPQI
jgi:predicted dehydrogenase